MHDWHEQVSALVQLLRVVSQILEEVVESLEVLEVLVGLGSGELDLLLELAERTGVGGLVLLEELKDLLDLL